MESVKIYCLFNGHNIIGKTEVTEEYGTKLVEPMFFSLQPTQNGGLAPAFMPAVPYAKEFAISKFKIDKVMFEYEPTDNIIKAYQNSATNYKSAMSGIITNIPKGVNLK